jgi:hypothetical protein
MYSLLDILTSILILPSHPHLNRCCSFQMEVPPPLFHIPHFVKGKKLLIMQVTHVSKCILSRRPKYFHENSVVTNNQPFLSMSGLISLPCKLFRAAYIKCYARFKLLTAISIGYQRLGEARRL